MLVFEERGNRSTRRKIFGCRVENQQTQPTYDAESGNRTRATLVGAQGAHTIGCVADCVGPLWWEAPSLHPSAMEYNFVY